MINKSQDHNRNQHHRIYRKMVFTTKVGVPRPNNKSIWGYVQVSQDQLIFDISILQIILLALLE